MNIAAAIGLQIILNRSTRNAGNDDAIVTADGNASACSSFVSPRLAPFEEGTTRRVHTHSQSHEGLDRRDWGVCAPQYATYYNARGGGGGGGRHLSRAQRTHSSDQAVLDTTSNSFHHHHHHHRHHYQKIQQQQRQQRRQRGEMGNSHPSAPLGYSSIPREYHLPQQRFNPHDGYTIDSGGTSVVPELIPDTVTAEALQCVFNHYMHSQHLLGPTSREAAQALDVQQRVLQQVLHHHQLALARQQQHVILVDTSGRPAILQVSDATKRHFVENEALEKGKEKSEEKAQEERQRKGGCDMEATEVVRDDADTQATLHAAQARERGRRFRWDTVLEYLPKPLPLAVLCASPRVRRRAEQMTWAALVHEAGRGNSGCTALLLGAGAGFATDTFSSVDGRERVYPEPLAVARSAPRGAASSTAPDCQDARVLNGSAFLGCEHQSLVLDSLWWRGELQHDDTGWREKLLPPCISGPHNVRPRLYIAGLDPLASMDGPDALDGLPSVLSASQCSPPPASFLAATAPTRLLYGVALDVGGGDEKERGGGEEGKKTAQATNSMSVSLRDSFEYAQLMDIIRERAAGRQAITSGNKSHSTISTALQGFESSPFATPATRHPIVARSAPAGMLALEDVAGTCHLFFPEDTPSPSAECMAWLRRLQPPRQAPATFPPFALCEPAPLQPFASPNSSASFTAKSIDAPTACAVRRTLSLLPPSMSQTASACTSLPQYNNSSNEDGSHHASLEPVAPVDSWQKVFFGNGSDPRVLHRASTDQSNIGDKTSLLAERGFATTATTSSSSPWSSSELDPALYLEHDGSSEASWGSHGGSSLQGNKEKTPQQQQQKQKSDLAAVQRAKWASERAAIVSRMNIQDPPWLMLSSLQGPQPRPIAVHITEAQLPWLAESLSPDSAAGGLPDLQELYCAFNASTFANGSEALSQWQWIRSVLASRRNFLLLSIVPRQVSEAGDDEKGGEERGERSGEGALMTGSVTHSRSSARGNTTVSDRTACMNNSIAQTLAMRYIDKSEKVDQVCTSANTSCTSSVHISPANPVVVAHRASGAAAMMPISSSSFSYDVKDGERGGHAKRFQHSTSLSPVLTSAPSVRAPDVFLSASVLKGLEQIPSLQVLRLARAALSVLLLVLGDSVAVHPLGVIPEHSSRRASGGSSSGTRSKEKQRQSCDHTRHSSSSDQHGCREENKGDDDVSDDVPDEQVVRKNLRELYVCTDHMEGNTYGKTGGLAVDLSACALPALQVLWLDMAALRQIHFLHPAKHTHLREIHLLLDLSFVSTSLLSVAALPALEVLHVEKIILNGLGFLAQCKTLRELLLHACRVPAVSSESRHALCGVGEAPALECLSLSYSIDVKHLDDIAKSSTLRKVVLTRCNGIATSAIAGLQLLPCLEELCLEYTRVDGMQVLATSQTLRVLRLDGCRRILRNSIVGLEMCIALQELSLSGTNVVTVSNLGAGSCIYLRSLDLSHCRYMDVDGLQGVQALPHLEVLSLSYTPITDVHFLQDCVALNSLYVEGCTKLAEDAFTGLQYVRTLERVVANFCTSLETVACLGESRSLRFLSLDGCSGLQTPAGLSGLEQCATLEYLSLADCPRVDDVRCLSRKGSHSRNGCEGMRYLSLKGSSALVSKGLHGLEALPRLEHLNIEELNKIDDINRLARSKSLRYVTVRGCTSLSDAGVREVLLARIQCVQ